MSTTPGPSRSLGWKTTIPYPEAMERIGAWVRQTYPHSIRIRYYAAEKLEQDHQA